MNNGYRWPGHAYVPGENERPTEEFFEDIKSTVRPGQSISEISQSRAFLFGFELLDRGFYWEAHEVWEPVWMAIPDNLPEKRFVQALIQTTNAFLKLRMQRPKAARRLCGLARALYDECDGEAFMGVSKRVMVQQVEQLEARINITL